MELLSALRTLEDHRGGQGRRYPLASIIMLVLLGFLTGRDSLAGVSRFAMGLKKRELQQLGIYRNRAPCHATICNTFHRVNESALSTLFGTALLKRRNGKEPLHLAVDGKSLCGSKHGDARSVHILHAFAKELGGVVDQVTVSSKTNEAKAMLSLLDRLELDETVITGDAMFCQKEIVKKNH